LEQLRKEKVKQQLENNAVQGIAQEIVDFLNGKKAKDVELLPVSHLTSIADYFIIASGTSDLQVKALSDLLDEMLSQKKDMQLFGREGYEEGQWILMDYGDIIVHIFHQRQREYYNLERLWSEDMEKTIKRIRE
jgi:ribosome-associated protein